MDALTKVTRGGQITLPAAVREALHIEQGDFMAVTVEDDRIVLTPMKLIDKSQAWFWTPEWQEGERQADEDIAAGRVHRFNSAKEAIASLRAARAKKQKASEGAD